MVIFTPVNGRAVYECRDSVVLLSNTSLTNRRGPDQIHAGCCEIYPGVKSVPLGNGDGEAFGVVWILIAAVN